MDRKKFILSGAASVFALSTFGMVSKNNKEEFKGDCETTNDILGPYYRPDAPIRENLVSDDLKGNRILLKGKVYTDDCTTVLENALVEIWHCDTEGTYDNDSKDFHQRASWLTSKKGEYSFKTILPGKYLNGRLYRPAHIHFRVTCDGHQELISQVYFKGDPHITEDPWASAKKAELRILDFIPEDIYGGLTVKFDVFLKKK